MSCMAYGTLPTEGCNPIFRDFILRFVSRTGARLNGPQKVSAEMVEAPLGSALRVS